jgi:hypothetical protein
MLCPAFNGKSTFYLMPHALALRGVKIFVCMLIPPAESLPHCFNPVGNKRLFLAYDIRKYEVWQYDSQA